MMHYFEKKILKLPWHLLCHVLGGIIGFCLVLPGCFKCTVKHIYTFKEIMYVLLHEK